MADKENLQKIKSKILKIHKTFKNFNLSEYIILESIKRESGIFFNLKNNIKRIVEYVFLEMLNNAIEHSQSKNVEIIVKRNLDNIRFDIVDFGVGVFNNVMKKRFLKSRMEVIQDLLKGKQTTTPDSHFGQGIFFTSKMADNFVLESSNKKLIFNNIVDDVFIDNIKNLKGTRVIFIASLNSEKKIKDIFDKYSDNNYEFDKTKIHVKLYKVDTDYISRS